MIDEYHAGPKFLTKLNLYPATRAYVRKVVLFYHSKVTDLRRPAGVQLELPAYKQTVTPTGTMYFCFCSSPPAPAPSRARAPCASPSSTGRCVSTAGRGA